ncbi:acetyltransferase [Vibrio sp. 16]|nr:acetyltransferase [Vibrio sp. 16]
MALIREMDISDYSQVIELWSETEAMLLRDADSRENIGKYLERNPNLSFVAVDGGTFSGYRWSSRLRTTFGCKRELSRQRHWCQTHILSGRCIIEHWYS